MKPTRLLPLLIVAALFAGLGWIALAPAPGQTSGRLTQPTSVAPPPPVSRLAEPTSVAPPPETSRLAQPTSVAPPPPLGASGIGAGQ
ncbi:MAG TPA: hypothetical protein VD886_14180 [Herpetosiphonaceae bacterium]|nr:hypothetical protein [Herpetosiphonaceae bacterium]